MKGAKVEGIWRQYGQYLRNDCAHQDDPSGGGKTLP